MLRLTDITKDYVSGDLVVHALRGVSLDFRKSEFVSVLGPSGCGKTTLLNIMGGLDKYTTGDLHINGISTKDYKSRDWDNYRNNSIGFIFQSYNLIAHQSVLVNVELALTLSGVGKKERRERAKQALIRVGLENEIYKKPNQLSGGQMQRVAIARAIVNDPEIILADEPTGALDSETSVQVMDILKEIASDRLVIMVTHNPDLAQKYSTRIIKMEDGLIVSDNNPLTESELKSLQESDVKVKEEKAQQPKQKGKKRKKKASMSFLTAFSLSLKNLFTKKARTILISIAGSIGIIGIALIMSVSAGFQGYIDAIQRDTLSSSPITLSSQSIDIMGMATSYMTGRDDTQKLYPNKDSITSDNKLQDMVDKFIGSMKTYDLSSFKKYMEDNIDNTKIHGYTYSYNLPLEFYGNGEIIHKNYFDTQGYGEYRQLYPYDTSRIQPSIFNESDEVTMLYSALFTMFNNMNPFSKTMVKKENGKFVNNWELIKTQYDLIDGDWATDGEKGEMMLVVDEYNRISDATLFALGLRSEGYVLYVMFDNMIMSNMLDIDMLLRSFEKEPQDFGADNNKGGYNTWAEYFKANEAEKDTVIYNIATTLMNVKFDINEVKNEILEGQKKEITFDEIYGVDYKVMTTTSKYKLDNGVYTKKTDAEIRSFLKSNKTDTVEVEITGVLRLKKDINSGCLDEGLVYQNELVDWLINTNNSSNIFDNIELGNPSNSNKDLDKFSELYGNIVDNCNYSSVKSALKYVNKAKPEGISIYASDFDNKDYITGFIDNYNKLAKLSETDEWEEVEYSDVMGSLFTSVSKIVNAISYVLIAFVSISLIVSSIMIGIITYISVLERTKEIGILRSIGASKRNVGTVFNAEALIIGFAGGFLGVMVAVLLNLPITAVLTKLTGTKILVRLPWLSGFILMGISMILTTIAGLIPSRMASKKDPVIALRSAG